jgi:hypothetical protein
MGRAFGGGCDSGLFLHGASLRCTMGVMRRVLFQGLAILSLVLFTATLIMWLRSYWRDDMAATSGFTTWTAESRLGSLTITRGENEFRTLRYWHTRDSSPSWSAIRERGFWFDFEAGEQDRYMVQITDPPNGPPVSFSTLYRHQSLTIPYWFPALVFSALPAWWLFQHRRRRPKPGLCPKCRYDLRAHAAGQKCPECGAVIKTPSQSAPV